MTLSQKKLQLFGLIQRALINFFLVNSAESTCSQIWVLAPSYEPLLLPSRALLIFPVAFSAILQKNQPLPVSGETVSPPLSSKGSISVPRY